MGRAIDDLPLFADDRAIGTALLGRNRALEWVALAPLYEERGLPKIDQRMGGRYVPAVKAFFDRLYSLENEKTFPLAPDGLEDLGAWTRRRKLRASGSEPASHPGARPKPR